MGIYIFKVTYKAFEKGVNTMKNLLKNTNKLVLSFIIFIVSISTIGIGKIVTDNILKAGNNINYDFELKIDDTLQIETNGDVSIVNSKGGLFQKEVKHHFGYKTLSDRDIDFWKTLANWYEEYDRVKDFSNYILSTTAQILDSSTFSGWNELIKEEKSLTFRRKGDRINSG